MYLNKVVFYDNALNITVMPFFFSNKVIIIKVLWFFHAFAFVFIWKLRMVSKEGGVEGGKDVCIHTHMPNP